jgi:ribose/xylose/arabinose/galactoside ABC-type transport system permease subunit
VVAALGKVSARYPNLGLMVSTVVFIAVTANTHPQFASIVNIRNLGRDWGILVIAAVGGMIVILVGGIDLSISANVALVAVASVMLSANLDPSLALGIGLLIGIGVGLINGIAVSYLRIDSVIVTIGMLQILTGAAFVLSSGAPVRAAALNFSDLGTGILFGPIAYPTMIAIPIVVLAWVFLKRTVWGRYVYGIGGSEDAARASGIAVARYKVLAFVISGGLAGLSGVMLASRVGGASATLGSSILITSVAAIFIGGVAFGGGVGGVAGVALGALLLTAIQNGLSFYGIDSFVQMIITGMILLLALYLNGLRRRT